MTARLYCGDALTVLPRLDAESVSAVVTDPPYGLAFMGNDWDHGIPGIHFWEEVARVAKPGAHLVAFGGTRTHHRLMCAIEDAGWEIRDVLMWLYGSGFPKSHNGPWGGTALKPAWEPIIFARKPLVGTVAANVQRYGTGALNIDGCRIETASWDYDHPGNNLPHTRRGRADWRMPDQQAKPNPIGRWPANLILDEDAAAQLDKTTGYLHPAGTTRNGKTSLFGSGVGEQQQRPWVDSGGGASRFFYCAKASRAERGNNNHPTVKPVALMGWLCRLATPTGGIILDPFMGSGSTGIAAIGEGFRFLGIDKEAEYVAIARERIGPMLCEVL